MLKQHNMEFHQLVVKMVALQMQSKDKETGIICDGNNLDEIYSTIDLVLKNNSYKELGKKAKDYVTKFEWNNIVKEYLKIFEQI